MVPKFVTVVLKSHKIFIAGLHKNKYVRDTFRRCLELNCIECNRKIFSKYPIQGGTLMMGHRTGATSLWQNMKSKMLPWKRYRVSNVKFFLFFFFCNNEHRSIDYHLWKRNIFLEKES